MNARISRDFMFQAAIHYEEQFIINSYSLTLFMDVTTEDILEQNVALDRIKYLLGNCIDNSVLVALHDKSAIENYIKAGIKICTLPDDPYDQVVAAVLLRKINNITDGKLFVTQIKIKSMICDDVEFYIDHDDQIDFLLEQNSWWNNNNTSVSDWARKVNKKDKVVELKKDSHDWAELNLSWKQKDNRGSEIVFMNLDK